MPLECETELYILCKVHSPYYTTSIHHIHCKTHFIIFLISIFKGIFPELQKQWMCCINSKGIAKITINPQIQSYTEIKQLKHDLDIYLEAASQRWFAFFKLLV